MKRLPSDASLAGMPADDRWTVLFILAAEARCEIDGLKHGSITAPRGTLKNTRRRLKRIEAAAARFGDYIGFEKPRYRVPAISRPLAA